MPSPRICKDCLSEMHSEEKWRTRPAPHRGPRCATHHREFVKRQKLAAHDKYVQRVYGLAPGEYMRLYEYQGGKCYICRRATGKTKFLAVDHCHQTGWVRGLLCGPCNRLVGRFGDVTARFYWAIEYLESYPAHRLGIYRKVTTDEAPEGP